MQLPRPGDPLVSKTGELIEASGRKEPDYSLEVPIAKHLIPKKLRSARELGADGQTQTVINAVLIYKLIGVGNNEVAHLLGTTPRDVEAIQNMPAFQETFEMVFHEMIAANSGSIQARIASYAGKALTNLMDLADAKPIAITRKDDDGQEYVEQKYFVPPIVILKANDSILDRSGLSADNLFGKNNDNSGQQLEIEVTQAADNKTNLKVNIKGGR